jgi:riboflavin synthase
MFTGLVREIGRLHAIHRHASVWRLQIDGPATATSLSPGDSVAVNGICLTVVGTISAGRFDVEATSETRRVTTLPRWRVGERLHLEPSLRAGDAVGGHFVFGHVDGVGRVSATTARGGAATVVVEIEPRLAAHLLPKGSIAVDGVSLTLDEGPFDAGFTVTLIPQTLAATRFGTLRAGSQVNVELDMLAKAAGGSGGGASRRAATTLTSLLARGWQGRGPIGRR